MSEKIRVICQECDKRLACPPAAAGKNIKCPGCGAAIKVPAGEQPASPQGQQPARRKRPGGQSGPQRTKRSSKSARRPAADGGFGLDDFGDDPYQSTVPAGAGSLPPRKSSKAKKSSGRRSAGTSGDDEKPGAMKMKLGSSIFMSSILVSVGRMAIFGPIKARTAAERGQALGFGLVVLMGIVAGVVMMIMGIRANRTAGRR